MDHELLLQAFQAAQKGQSYAFATIVSATRKGTPRKAGAKLIVLADGSLFGSIGGGRNEKAAKEECLKAIKSGKPALVTYDYFGHEGQSICGGQMQVFIEPFKGQKHLIICGGGHIALPLSAIGKMLNYKVTIIDNRKEFGNSKRFPHVDAIILDDYTKALKRCKINPQTAIMIVTQGNEFDFKCLEFSIHTNAWYIGVISSKPKRVKFFNRLKKSGITDRELKKIAIPAGLDLGAQTPEEIAVSITSEMIRVANQNATGTDKFKEKERKKL